MLAKAGSREDGKETQERIIQTAGPLFAQNGYDGTTSKAICQQAGVNMAAVNYHFGSRDGLYIAILEEVQDYLLNIDVLKKLAQQEGTPRQKLELFVDYFIEDAFFKNDWHVRLWIRELLHPSPHIQKIIAAKSLPKFYIAAEVFGKALGYNKTDIVFYSAYISLISPFIMTFLAQNSPVLEALPVHYPKEQFIAHLKENFFKTFDALSVKPTDITK